MATERPTQRTAGLSTQAVHGGEARTKDANAIVTPIIQSATYTFANTQEIADRLRERNDLSARRRGDGDGNLIVSDLGRLAPSDDRFARVPRRNAIDLRADDAVEKFRCAPRQFERAEEKSVRAHGQLDPAAF